MDAKIRHKFIQHNFVDCFNSIIEDNKFAIIKYGSYKFDNNINRLRRNILANMLRSSGHGFIAAEKICTNTAHSDHEESPSALLIPGMDAQTAEYIANKINIYDFLVYEPNFSAQICHTYLISDVKQLLPKDLCVQKITDTEIAKYKQNSLYSLEDGSSKWLYNFSRANKELLCHLLDTHSHKFVEPTQEYANATYHESFDENNLSLFVFSRIIKFMPTDVLVNNDQFKNTDIVGRLDAYLPLLEKNKSY
jgi:hypothetical protein